MVSKTRSNPYPKDWDKISERIRKRAKYCCEKCGVKNGDYVQHSPYKILAPEEYEAKVKRIEAKKRKEKKRTIIIDDDGMMWEVQGRNWILIGVDDDHRGGYFAEGEYHRFDYEPPRPQNYGCTRIRIVVHHKDQNPANNDDSNLIALCGACHAKEHNYSWRGGG